MNEKKQGLRLFFLKKIKKVWIEIERDKSGNNNINHIYLLSMWEEHTLFKAQITRGKKKNTTKFQWACTKINKYKIFDLSINDKCFQVGNLVGCAGLHNMVREDLSGNKTYKDISEAM